MFLGNSDDQSNMDTGTNKKYRYELDTWSRLLDYLQQENVYFKNLLSHVIKNDKANTLLEKAEYFQNKFVNKDAVIVLLRQDISEQMKWIEKGGNNEQADLYLKKHKRLNQDIDKLEEEFKRLKVDFSDYVAVD